MKNDFVGTMKILREPEFQNLLVNYPRAKKAFYVAYDTQDDVKSELIIREPMGEYLKPEDYIESFSRFVRENKDKVEAIKILLERPSDWGTRALHELRRKLRENRFTEDKLRKAYHNEMADIISMVKHAANEENPLLTAQERVDRAIKRITEGMEFTEEQLKWLNLIKAHLEVNLAIDQEDFDNIPAFSRKGGWKAASKVFDNLEELLKKINEAVAA